MKETSATARETAQKLRDLAKASGSAYGNAYLAMAEWWNQEAVRLEALDQAEAAPVPDVISSSRAA